MDSNAQVEGKEETLKMSEIEEEHTCNEKASSTEETVSAGTESIGSDTEKQGNVIKVDILGGHNFQCGDSADKSREINKPETSFEIPVIIIEEPVDCPREIELEKCADLSKSLPLETSEETSENNGQDPIIEDKDVVPDDSHNNSTNNAAAEIKLENVALSGDQREYSKSEGANEIVSGSVFEDISPKEGIEKNDFVQEDEKIHKEEALTTDETKIEFNDTKNCSQNLEKDVEQIDEEQIPEKKQGEIHVVEEDGHRSEAEDEKPSDDVPNGDPQKNRSRTYPYKVFVSGLPLTARLEDITYYFSQFGEVFKTFNEGRHKANIIFSDAESVKKAVFCPDPYFDDHKLLIRSVNEVTAVINGVPKSLLLKDAEKAIKKCMAEAEVPVCRVSIPYSDTNDTNQQCLLQGHVFVVFCDQLTLQKAEERQKTEPFIVADTPVVLFPSINQFYKQFCVRVYPLPAEQPRSVVYHTVRSTLSECGDIIAEVCVFIQNSSSYAVYVLFAEEEAVKKALEMEDVKIFEQFVEVQEFHPFEMGQGFRHLWLKVLNLPQRVTVTEVKHHFGHDKGILDVELDMDFGSCFLHVDSEHAIQRCLRMHQTYFRGKCITVMLADEHPGRNNYYRGGRQNRNRSNYNRNTRKPMGGKGAGGYNGITFSSGQNYGNHDRRGYDWKDRKFSKQRNSASEGSQQPQNSTKTNGGEGKAEEHAAA